MRLAAWKLRHSSRAASPSPQSQRTMTTHPGWRSGLENLEPTKVLNGDKLPQVPYPRPGRESRPHVARAPEKMRRHLFQARHAGLPSRTEQGLYGRRLYCKDSSTWKLKKRACWPLTVVGRLGGSGARAWSWRAAQIRASRQQQRSAPTPCAGFFLDWA